MITEDDIPQHWEMAELGGIAQFQNGYGFSSDQWEESGLPIIRIQNLTGTGDEFNYYSGDVDEKYHVREGDLLFSWSGTIEAFWWSGPHGILNQHIYKVNPHDKADKRYVHWLLKYCSKVLEKMKQGAAMQHIKKGMVTGFEVPLPPLEEQERIVEVLDAGFESLDRVDELSERVDEYSEEFINSLSHHMFAPEEVPEDWNRVAISELATRLRSTVDPSESPDTEYEYYSFPAFDSEGSPVVTQGSEINSRKRELEGGELMVSRLNPRIKRVWEVSDSDKPKIASTEFVAINVDDSRVRQRYLYHFFNSEASKNILCSKVKGAVGSRSRVSYDDVMDIRVPLPPIDEQDRIIQLLDSVRSRMGSSKSQNDTLQTTQNQLRESLLSNAFTGELIA